MLFDWFLVALCTFLLYRYALVVVMNKPRSARSALSAEIGSAITAEQLGRQQIIVLCFMTGRSLFVLCHLFLHTIKQIFGNNGRNAIRDNDFSVTVLTNVSSIVQHVLDTVVGHFLSAGILDSFLIEPITNLRHSRTFIISLERFKDKRRGQRIDLEILLAVNDISEGMGAAVVFAFQRVFCHAPYNFFCKVSRIIFSHSLKHGFQQNTLGSIGDRFGCGNNFYSVFLELCLISCAVIAISCKAVKLPNDNHVKQLFTAVFNHCLKLRAVICFGGEGTVYVVPQNRNAVLFRKGSTLSKLPFNAFFSLAIGRIAGVDYGFHSFSSSIIFLSVSFNHSFMAEPGSKHISINLSISG